MNKQILIDEMTSTLLKRLEYFVEQEDFETSDAIYQEFVVNGLDPEEEKYEWCFLPNLMIQ